MPTLPHQYTDDGRNILEEIGLDGLKHPPSLPVDTVIKSDGTKWVYGQVSGNGNGTGGQQFFEEVLTITTDNVIPPISYTPKFADKDVWLTLGSGWVVHSVKEGGFTVNPATRTITLVAGADYVVKAGWQVTVRYATDDDVSPPTITAVSPSPVTVGQTLTITGTGFTPTATLTVGGQSLTPTFVSATTLTVVLPALPYSGTVVTVQTVTGQATNNGFNFTAPVPTITSFAPISQQGGNTVVITGTNFYGTPTVRFGGVVSPTVVVNSPTQITATVGTGASGVIQVETLYGVATRNGFTWLHPVPTITSFAPTAQVANLTVVITGTNFINVSQVQFGGVNATSFVVNSPTQITATVGTGASGNVTVTNPGGTATLAGFTYQAPIILPFPQNPTRLATGFAGTLSNGVSYIVRASHDAANNAWQAFDNPALQGGSSYWFATGGAAEKWIEIEFSVPVMVSSVDLNPHPGGYQPRDFRFLLSDTHNAAGTGYSTALTRTNETWPLNTFSEIKNFVIPVANRQTRKIFRMAITASVSFGSNVGIYSIILQP